MGHHDLFFKQTFSIREHVVDYLQHILPSSVGEKIDYTTVAIEKGSHVDSSLSEYFSDTIYSCRFSGTDLKIALLFEHKSNPDNNLPFQLHRYMANLWKNSVKQKKARIPVIPIVLYHGVDTWNPGLLSSKFKNLPDEIRPFIPDFEYIFVNLSDYSNDYIKKDLFTLASLRIAMLLMKNIFDQELLSQHMKEFFELGRLTFQEEQGLNFLKSVINYLYKATEIEINTVVESIASITAKGGEFAMSTAERLRKEGMQQGRQQGRQEASNKMILSLVQNAKKQGFPIEMIAKIVDLDITLVEKILNHEKVDVPLHLLNLENKR